MNQVPFHWTVQAVQTVFGKASVRVFQGPFSEAPMWRLMANGHSLTELKTPWLKFITLLHEVPSCILVTVGLLLICPLQTVDYESIS